VAGVVLTRQAPDDHTFGGIHRAKSRTNNADRGTNGRLAPLQTYVRSAQSPSLQLHPEACLTPGHMLQIPADCTDETPSPSGLCIRHSKTLRPGTWPIAALTFTLQDGVLIRGSQVIPEVKEVFSILDGNNPFRT